MKYILSFLFIGGSAIVSAQSIAPFFTAVIVEDIEVSTEWYAEIFGLEELNNMEDEERGYIIRMLGKDGMAVELLQLRNARTPSELTADSESKLIKGLFKIGFVVQDFDRWEQMLKEKEVTFHGSSFEDPITRRMSTIVLDPDGNRIQLFGPVLPK